MADTTGIEWTEARWNPVVGCALVSPGCTNCYAMQQAARIERMAAGAGNATHYAGLTRSVKGKPVWTGEFRAAPDAILTQPLRWKRPRRIFVNSMSDLFGEGVPDDVIDRVFAVMALTPQHTYQVLTKRPERMLAYLTSFTKAARVADAAGKLVENGDAAWAEVYHQAWPLPNVWLGVSVERQQEADERIPHLLATPAAVRFISAEPLLGPVDLTRIVTRLRQRQAEPDRVNALNGQRREGHGEFEGMFEIHPGPRLDWVIVGGESGRGARPMHPDWARSLRDQCADAGVAFFFKQWGEFREFDTGPGTIEVDNDSDIADDMVAAAINPSRVTRDGRHITKRAEMPIDTPCRLIERVGKARAGRLLDGVEHNAMPEARR